MILLLNESPYSAHRFTRYKRNFKANINAPLDLVGREWGCRERKAKGYIAPTGTLEAEEKGAGLLLCFQRRLGWSSVAVLAPLRVSVPGCQKGETWEPFWWASWVYSRLIESDKECGGWTACTEVKPQSFKIVLLKASCFLECSWPSQLPSTFSLLLQGSLLRRPFPGRERGAPHHSLWNFTPPSIPGWIPYPSPLHCLSGHLMYHLFYLLTWVSPAPFH